MSTNAKETQAKTKRPIRLDLKDMPRDTNRVLGSLRQNICAAFNYCRRYPLKMAVLKETLKFTLEAIEVWEGEEKVRKAGQAKKDQVATLKAELAEGVAKASKFTDTKQLDEFAAGLGVKLDGRKSLEDMKTSFGEQYKALLTKKLK